MQEKDHSNLLKPGSAVEDFLDTLLQESTEQPKPQKVVQLKSKSNLVLLPELQQEIVTTQVAIDKDATKVEQPAIDIEQTLLQKKEKSDLQLNSYDYTFPLQCLMFSVCGNQLSIPLIKMGSVLTWGGRLTMLPGSPDWFLGILKHRELNVKVADTAKIIQINSCKEQQPDTQHILVFGDDNWAITCDTLGNVVNLKEQDVKWSKQNSNTFSLGTIKHSLATLLDPKKILKQLNKYESDRIS